MSAKLTQKHENKEERAKNPSKDLPPHIFCVPLVVPGAGKKSFRHRHFVPITSGLSIKKHFSAISFAGSDN
jgi:hypothetical protein